MSYKIKNVDTNKNSFHVSSCQSRVEKNEQFLTLPVDIAYSKTSMKA